MSAEEKSPRIPTAMTRPLGPYQILAIPTEAESRRGIVFGLFWSDKDGAYTNWVEIGKDTPELRELLAQFDVVVRSEDGFGLPIA